MNIFVSLPAQTLELFGEDGLLLRRYAISTAKKGAGEQYGSFMTPRGRHVIRARIGAGCAENTVFVRRRPTGEIWTPELAAQFPGRDWMLTRILWLSGRQPGFNRLGKIDTMRRYIYLHGSPDSAPMGEPGSIGCVRMRNCDIIELFDIVPPYTPVNIGEYRIVSGDLAFSSAQLQAFPDAAGNEYSALSLHALAFDAAGNAIGKISLRPGGIVAGLAVLPEWRGKEVAGNLLRRLLEVARTAGIGELTLQAPQAAVPLFMRLGFAAIGAESRAAGIPHLRMRRVLSA
jgi:GNAT superfamily N-acetyltransferase